MAVQLPKWKSFTLPDWQLPYILREPPKSIHTRKKERVDMSDVNYMITNDDSRINEGINYLARGINPMVDVMYNNVGGKANTTNTMPNIQASNPYKVIKDGAFRPPIYTQEDLLPLSRMRRPESAVVTNPGMREGFVNPNLAKNIDTAEIKSAISTKTNYYSIRPTIEFKVGLPNEIFPERMYYNAINDITLNAPVSSNISMQKNTNMEISVDNNIKTPLNYSGTSNISMQKNTNMELSVDNNIKDPLNYSGTTNINLLGNTQKYEYNNINQASKNGITTSANSTFKLEGEPTRTEIDTNPYIKDNIILKNINPNFSIIVYDPLNKNYSEVKSNIKDKINIAVTSSLNKPIHLTLEDGSPIKLKEYRWKVVNSAVGRDYLVLYTHDAPELELSRNIPLYNAISNISGNSSKAERFDSVIPIMNNKINTNVSTNAQMNITKNAIYHNENDIKLDRMSNFGSFNNMGSISDINRITPQLEQNKVKRK